MTQPLADVLIRGLGDRITVSQRRVIETEISRLSSRDVKDKTDTVNGQVARIATSNVEVEYAQGVISRNSAGQETIRLRPDGSAFFGANLLLPATTALSVLAIEQTYNRELFGAGDVMLGDNSNGKANMLWDASTGKLLFRGGQTAQVYIDTNGKVTAGAGAVTLDTAGISATAGAIGGWTLGATALTAGSAGNTVGLDSGGTNPALYAGSATPASAPFRVTKAGALTATNATITGSITALSGTIGGWSIGATALTAGSAGNTVGLDSGGTNPALYAGSATPASAPFRVTKAGALTATSATIGGWTVDSTTIKKTGIILDSNADTIYVGAAEPRIIIDGANKYLQSSTYTSGVAGFSINGATGDAEFNNCNIRGELRSSVFKYSEITATAGTFGVFKSASTLYLDATIVTIGSNTYLNVKNTDAGASLFAVNDKVRIKHWNGSDMLDVWLTVININTVYSTHTKYLCTIESGSENWIAPAGTAVVDYGPSGTGFITQSADGAIGSSPNLTMATHAGSPWTTITPLLRIGNLNGYLGYATNTYGLGIGATGQANLVANATSILLRDGTTERLSLSAGAVAIKNSSGNAVFTFNSSAGAEFTLPLTLASTGGIYQGTGTFASPTTGLKIWNDSGIGRIGGYNASALQWYGSTDGKFYFGGGDGRIDANGITLETGSSMWSDPSGYTWEYNGDKMAGWYSTILGSPTFINYLSAIAYPVAGYRTNIDINSYCNAGDNAQVYIHAKEQATGGSSYISLNAGDNTYALIDSDGWVSIGTNLRVSTGLYVGSTATEPTDDDVRIDGGLTLNVATNPAAGDLLANNDGRFGGGLYVGSLGTDPAADTITADGDIKTSTDIRIGGGLYVGAIDVDPTAGQITTTSTIEAGGDIVTSADIRIAGGLYVGSTGTDPAADTITADGQIIGKGSSGSYALSAYSGANRRIGLRIASNDDGQIYMYDNTNTLKVYIQTGGISWTLNNLGVGTSTDGMTANGSLAIAQDLAHRGSKAGFFNAATVTQPAGYSDLATNYNGGTNLTSFTAVANALNTTNGRINAIFNSILEPLGLCATV